MRAQALSGISYCRDDHGRLALHWAAASGHADLVALLLGAAKAQKAAVEAAPEEADAALLGLVGKPVHDIQVLLAHCLVQRSEKFDIWSKLILVVSAACSMAGHTATHPQHYSTGMQDKQGNTALHMAARRMDVDCLKLLLEAASEESYRTTNNLKETPLHVAAKGKYIAAAQLLTEAAPQMLTVQDTRGLTPAQWAKRCGHDVGSLRTLYGIAYAISPEALSGLHATPGVWDLPMAEGLNVENISSDRHCAC